MPSLISCPGCKHKLTLPDDFGGQRVQCPRCAVEFAAEPLLAPSMEVGPPALPPDAPPPTPEEDAAPPKSPVEPLPKTGYAAAGTSAGRAPGAAEVPWVYCIMCGGRVREGQAECPECGHAVHEPPRDEYPRRRPPRARTLHPINATLPLIAAVLMGVGLVLLIGAPIFVEVMRRMPSRFVFATFLIITGLSVESVAVALSLVWLYQAWRAVLHGDEEYSPGLMVGLLFVPFFNFYWIFRAIAGLSAAIHKELKEVAPRRDYGAGWIPGLVACIFALVPYGQPVAVCVFLAWMLIANSALLRLIRFHEELRREERVTEETAAR